MMNDCDKSLETEVAQTIVSLKSRFVVTDRFEAWLKLFSRQVNMRLAAIEHGTFVEARGLALIGASGSGKTAMMDYLLKNSAKSIGLDFEANEKAVVSLRIPSPATIKFVGRELLWAVGYPLQADRAAHYIWERVRFHAKEQHVIFMHFDEAQDLYTQGSERELQYIINTLKSLMQSKDWPVGIILVGTDALTKLLEYDPQLGRRIEPYRLQPLSSADDDELLGFCEGYAQKARLQLDNSILKDEFAARLRHASNYAFGVSIELIIDAIRQSLLHKSDTLRVENFASAYALRRDCFPAFNPFLVREFLDIDVQKLDQDRS